MTLRVRFAPSPTGYLHVGGARTALINWLFARKNNGVFILRVEDTDEARSTHEMTQAILDGLEWLGITWDEGPYFQSERREHYVAAARRVLESGHGYRCFCTRLELESRRAACGRPEEWRYDRRCAGLPAGESERRARAGEAFVVRCRIPDEPLEWDDLVKGRIRFEPSELEDFILLRSDRTPTYHLSVVTDDLEMRITHVIRGEDHISNTPKQIALYRALGERPPIFGHLPLILGPDKRKLSKRHGVTSVLAYRGEGVLSLALFNFLAQLGAYLGEEPYLPVEQVLERFSLDSLKKAASVFDRDKLAFINYRVILDTPAAGLRALVKPFLEAEFSGRLYAAPSDGALDLMKTRAKNLRDLASMLVPLLTEDFPIDPAGLALHARDAAVIDGLARLRTRYEALEAAEWMAPRLEEILRGHAESENIRAAELIHLARLFVTGRTASPGIFELLAVLGKEGTVRRMDRGLREARIHLSIDD